MNSLIYDAGTVTVSGGSAIVTGNLTGWAVALVEGGMFSCDGLSIPILSVEDDTHLTLAYGWPGDDGSGKTYAISRTPSEVTARAATWTVDRLARLAQTPWGVGVVPDGRGTLAQRDALDPMPTDDFCWLRVEVDEPAELYFRDAGQWLGPYEFTAGEEGPPGPLASIEIGDTTTLAPGSDATVTNSGTPTAPILDFGIPAGAGFDNKGAYASGTAYLKGDVVTYNGSSYIAKQASTGNAPTNGTYWDLLAAKGTDGTGTGDVVGPSSSTDGYAALMSGTTGKLLKQTPEIRVDATSGNVGIGGAPSGSLKFRIVAPDATIGLFANNNAAWSGANLYDASGAAAASFQYGNPGASALANEFAIATRQSTIPLKFYQGGITSGRERLRIDASNQIMLLNSRVGIGTDAPNASAILDVFSTTAGFLPPRMTTTQRNAISAPVAGLTIYNTTAGETQFYNGSAWVGGSVPDDVYKRANVLGTVSQSASVPTGALIENGSGANGSYLRFTDGTQICRNEVTLTGSSTSYFRGSWTFPALFSAAPLPLASIKSHNGGYSPSDRGAYGSFWADSISGTGITYIDIVRSYGAGNVPNTATVTINILAIGRWF